MSFDSLICLTIKKTCYFYVIDNVSVCTEQFANMQNVDIKRMKNPCSSNET